MKINFTFTPDLTYVLIKSIQMAPVQWSGSSRQLLTRCSGKVYFDLQNVLWLVSLFFSFHLPSCSHTPALFHPSFSHSLHGALGMPRGDGSLAPQLRGCRTGGVTFKPSISTLSLPELSALSARHKEKEESSTERGRCGHQSGLRVRWTE